MIDVKIMPGYILRPDHGTRVVRDGLQDINLLLPIFFIQNGAFIPTTALQTIAKSLLCCRLFKSGTNLFPNQAEDAGPARIVQLDWL